MIIKYRTTHLHCEQCGNDSIVLSSIFESVGCPCCHKYTKQIDDDVGFEYYVTDGFKQDQLTNPLI